MKLKKEALALALMALCMLLLYGYFYVDGKEIQGVEQMDESCTVTIKKYRHMLYEDRVEYILDEDGIARLKALVLDSHFTRNLAGLVTFEAEDMYDILVDFNDGHTFLALHCIGNEWVTVSNQFDGKHLKINNRAWTDGLEAIIATAQPVG